MLPTIKYTHTLSIQMSGYVFLLRSKEVIKGIKGKHGKWVPDGLIACYACTNPNSTPNPT